jgi:hypothetical protein
VPGIETCGELPWHELMARLTQARVAFFPNVLDASPVFLTEALCLDVPIVVNRRILGGWKYVRPGTGRFFTDENDVTGAVAGASSSRRARGSAPSTGPATPRAGSRRSSARRPATLRARARAGSTARPCGPGASLRHRPRCSWPSRG